MKIIFLPSNEMSSGMFGVGSFPVVGGSVGFSVGVSVGEEDAVVAGVSFAAVEALLHPIRRRGAQSRKVKRRHNFFMRPSSFFNPNYFLGKLSFNPTTRLKVFSFLVSLQK